MKGSSMDFDLERISFINLVNFYRPELQRIIEGGKTLTVIPQRNTRHMLHKHGVLRRNYGGNTNGRGAIVTREAERVLWEEEDNGKIKPREVRVNV